MADRAGTAATWMQVWWRHRGKVLAIVYPLVLALFAAPFLNELELLAGWLRDSLALAAGSAVREPVRFDGWHALFAVLTGVAAVACLEFARRNAHFATASVTPAQEHTARRILLTGLSYTTGGDEARNPASMAALESAIFPDREGAGRDAMRHTAGHGISVYDALTRPLRDLPPAAGESDFFRRNPYLQTLRAIRPHEHRADTPILVVLLPSPQSAALVGRFAAVIDRLYNRHADAPRVRTAFFDDPGAVDYESYDRIVEAIGDILRRLARRDVPLPLLGRPDGAPALSLSQALGGAIAGDLTAELCIETTAGKKVFSIAAAVMTLNTRAIFSYVTGADDHAKPPFVKFFDARCELASFETF